MAPLHLEATVTIDRPHDVVRSQFGDVAHHQQASPHRGVTFEVLHDDGTTCRYRQTSRVGLLKLRQEVELVRAADGPLVNTFVAGPFAGASLSFEVDPDGPARSIVTARLRGELSGLTAVAAPLLRATVRRSLAAALAEDKVDLESGRYAPGPAVDPAVG